MPMFEQTFKMVISVPFSPFLAHLQAQTGQNGQKVGPGNVQQGLRKRKTPQKIQLFIQVFYCILLKWNMFQSNAPHDPGGQNGPKLFFLNSEAKPIPTRSHMPMFEQTFKKWKFRSQFHPFWSIFRPRQVKEPKIIFSEL